MKTAIIHITLVCFALSLHGESLFHQEKGLGPGDKVDDFSLTGIDGNTVSLSDYMNKKGVIIIFTSNSCPFATGYEERMIALHNKYAREGFPVIAINPNDEKQQPGESMEKMIIKSETAGFPFPYLKDDIQLCRIFGASRTPEVYLLQKDGETFRVAYTGAIDSQPIRTNGPNTRYLENALSSLLRGETPDPAVIPAVGCTIKNKRN